MAELAEGVKLKKSRRLPTVSRDVREIVEGLREEEERSRGFYERVCSGSRRVFGGLTKNMTLQEDTIKNISWAGLRVTPQEWWAGFLTVTLVPAIATVISWFVLVILGGDLLALWYLPIMGFVLGGLMGIAFYYYPISAADIRRSEAQANAIQTTMLLSFALQHRSDLRGALVFAANESEGKLAEDLRSGLLELDQKRGYESVRHLLTVLAHHWREVDEGVRRAIFDILRSTGQREEAARKQDVTMAPRRVLESSEQQLGVRLDALVMPTITFMVFGSLAIVAVIGLSPIFGMIGLNFININFFALAAGALVASFLAFTVFIARRRPVTVPPPKISPDDPRLPPPGKFRLGSHALPLWLPAVLIFVVLAIPGIFYFLGMFPSIGIISGFNTFWLVWAVTGALAIYAYLYVGPRAKIRDEVRGEMDDWSMALNTMGSRIIDGRPMHLAMRETAELMPETTVGEQLQHTSDTMEKFSVDAQYAFTEGGVAKRIYNPLVASLLGVITTIRRGSEASSGRACMMAAEFLDTLYGVERRFREKIGDATGNLWLMAIILLPIVCALSVWIMEFMSGISMTVGDQAGAAGLANLPFLTGTMEVGELALLKLIMGLTTVALSLIVARHIATIRGGRDPIEFWKIVAPTVLASAAIFTGAYIGFGLLKVVGV